MDEIIPINLEKKVLPWEYSKRILSSYFSDKFIKSEFSLDFVTVEVWRKNMKPFKGNILVHSNLINIVIMQTGGDQCSMTEACINSLRTMQVFDVVYAIRIIVLLFSQKAYAPEIPYNFLIGGDGQTYEIRGWNLENGLDYLPKISTIVIGFVGNCYYFYFYKLSWSINIYTGNYNIISPSEKQFKNAYSLIEEMRRRKLLHENFRIFGFQNVTNSLNEGQQIYREISKWKRFSTILKML